jgi:bifunctional ADP-heptose synthase (sugar kinase/adenylyltransferase)
MSLFQADSVEHVKAKVLEVADVTGAGDTVIATLALMLASGLSMAQSMEIANRAGGLVVSKFGTSTASYEELFA